MLTDIEESLVCRIVTEGIAPRERIERALRDRPPDQPLGVFLVLAGLLTPDQLERVLFPSAPRAEAPHDVLLADALVEGRVVGPSDVEAALTLQRDVPLPLGSLLVRLGQVAATRIRETMKPLAGSVAVEEPDRASWPPEVVAAARDPKRRFGHHFLIEEVGRGGMGVVYRAYDALLDRVVALKMLLTEATTGRVPSEVATSPASGFVERFQREARAAARLHHPGIIPVYEVGFHEGTHFFSMEFVEGPSLEKVLRGARLAPLLAARLLREAAEAVHHSHEAGVIHRDLKPANLLLSEGPRGELSNSTVTTRFVGVPVIRDLPGRVRIADFGLARVVAAPGMTASGEVIGTPAYMSPEQARGLTDSIDARSDVYALGAVLYHAVTGVPPFLGIGPIQVLSQVVHDDPAPPRARVPEVPVDIEVVCLRAMAKEPERRYPDARAFADDLGRFLAGEPIRARPVGRLERLSRWTRRRKALAAALLALAMAVSAGTAASIQAWRNWREATALREARERATPSYARGSELAMEARRGLLLRDPDLAALRRKLDLAERALDTALHEDPTFVEARYVRSGVRSMRGDVVAAIQDLDEILRLSPRHVPARMDRALNQMYLVVTATDRFLQALSATGMRLGDLGPLGRDRLRAIREDLDRVASLEPDRLRSRGTPVWLLLLDGRPAEALALVDEILSAERDRGWAWFLRGRCLVELGCFGDALSDIDRALALEPNDASILYVRGLLLLHQGRGEEGVQALRRVLELMPPGDSGPWWVASVLLFRGYPKEALTELARHPGEDVRRLTVEGQARLAVGEVEAAQAAFARAIELDASLPEPRLWLGVARLRGGDVQGALDGLRDALARGMRPSWSVRWIAGSEMVRAGRSAEALTVAEDGLREEPSAAELYFLRGQARLELGEAEAAEKDFAEAVRRDPLEPLYRDKHAVVLVELDQLPEALAELEEARRLDPGNAVYHNDRGRCLKRMRRLAEALAAYDEAVRLDPDTTVFRFNRAMARMAADHWEPAAEDLSAILEKEPGHPEARESRGACYVKLERWAEARSDLEQAAAADPEDAENWYWLGVAAHKLDDDTAAIDALRRAEALQGPIQGVARRLRERIEKR